MDVFYRSSKNIRKKSMKMLNLSERSEQLVNLVFFRFISFNDMRTGYELHVPDLKFLEKPTRASCASSCNLTPACKSFNFCHKRFCYLNEIDAFDLAVRNSLKESEHCLYGGMLLETKPTCNESGIAKSIRVYIT